MNFDKEIKLLISSRNFIIQIITEEEERLEYNLNTISKKLFKQNIYTWDFIEGYKNNPNNKNSAKKNPLEALEKIESNEYNNTKIFLLKDFTNFINELSIIRKIKNLNIYLKQKNKYIFIINSNLQIPESLKEYITIVFFPLPNQQEITLEIIRLKKILNINYIETELLANIYQGFSIENIRKSMCKINLKKNFDNTLIQEILQEKQNIIKKSNILELDNNNYNLKDIAGLRNLKKWLKVRNNAFSKKAYKYGMLKPKGILLVGVQGTGKSLSAKAISLEWKLPLLKLDISKIFTGILGESELNMKKMIHKCEQVSPCILWIDEIDKIFNQNNYNNDSGTINRINNIFLSWLSENNKKVFIVATANNLNNLPIEMLRKGRFDEIFFVNLPNFEERLHTFKIHLKKIRPLTWHKYNLYYLSQISKNFSGAEIEQSINEAMYNAFYENREFLTKDIIQSIKITKPLSSINETKYLKLQKLVKSGKIRIA